MSGENGGCAVDLDALIRQLEAELRRGGRRGAAAGSSMWLDARATADRTWRVSADRPAAGRGGKVGALQRPVKAVVRKLTRWYVEPVFADQRGYNDAMLKLVDELAAEVDRLRLRVDELEARP